jgi:dienelactone hydrolase
MSRLGVLALVVALGLGQGCSLPVQGSFVGRELPPPVQRRQTIVIIYNHGSTDMPGFRPRLPPILELARERNGDVVVYTQVRSPDSQPQGYVEAAVEFFRAEQHVPLGNIILAGNSCGGWGSLQAAAFTYPEVGGVVAFAPTCHGRLPHSSELRARRSRELGMLADRARFPALIFLYDGDSYYDLEDWDGFESRVPAGSAGLRLERVSRAEVLRVCARCIRDSHAAVWDREFANAFFDSHVQPFIERVRAEIRARTAGGGVPVGAH